MRLTERGPGVAHDRQAAAKPTLVVAVAQPQVTGLPHAADQVHRAVAAVHAAARRGAELLVAPAGGAFGPLRRNWQLVARARAIENQCYLALTQGLFGEEAGLAMIAGPEDNVAELAAEGVLVAHLDLQRLRSLRASDDSMAEPKQLRSLPGLLRARRPNLYGELAAAADGLYDYEAVTAPTAPHRS